MLTCSPRVQVALNPGAAPADTDYYNLADILLTAENFYADFRCVSGLCPDCLPYSQASHLSCHECSPSQLSLGSSTPASKQAIVLTDGPSTPPTDLISQLITTDKVGAFWVTDDTQVNGANPYDTLPADIESFVADVEAAQS